MASVGVLCANRALWKGSLFRTATSVALAGSSRAERTATAAIYKNIRYMSSRREHLFIGDFGLISDYVPTPWSKRPSIFSSKGISDAKSSFLERSKEIFGHLTIMWNLSGWKRASFATQAEELYNAMNESFARGDGRALDMLCFPNMASSLKKDVKRRKNNFDWEMVRSVEPAKVVSTRCARLTSDYVIGQVVVKIVQDQAVTPLKSSRNGKQVRVKEYVVFQRVVSDPSAPWCVYGKLDVPKWDQ